MKYTEIRLIHGELVPVTVYPLTREPNHLNPVTSKTWGGGGKVPAFGRRRDA